MPTKLCVKMRSGRKDGVSAQAFVSLCSRVALGAQSSGLEMSDAPTKKNKETRLHHIPPADEDEEHLHQ